MTIVTIEDCIQSGFCTRGIMRVARRHGLDFTEFKQNGIPADTLLALDDLNATRAVEKAKAREEGI